MDSIDLDVFYQKNRKETIKRISLLKPLVWGSKSIKKAAVLLPLCIYQNSPSLLYIKRPINMRTHPGQIA